MPESSPSDNVAAKPGRIRKWGVRFLKTLAVLTAILALVHIEEYWRGERAYNRAVAAWKAAGLPSAKEFFKDDPIVPTDKNLLDAPFYSAWKQPSQEASKKPDARWQKWALLGTTAIPQAAGGSFETDWRKLFTYRDKSHPGLQSVPGKSDAQVLIDTVEADYPELKTFGDAERTHPEVSFGYKSPATDNMFAADIPSFRAIRDSSYPLVFHAAAKLETGDGAPALSATRASLRIETALGEGIQHTLVSTMIACVHAKMVPVRLIFEATRRGAWSDEELQSIEVLLEGLKPLNSLHVSMMAEGLSSASYVAARSASETLKLLTFNDESIPANTPLSYIIPSGWLKTNAASLLDIARENLAIDGAKDGRAFLTAQSAKALRAYDAKLAPDYCIALMAQPAFKKVRTNAAQAQTKLNCARLGIALERHRLKTGVFPDSLSALMPGLMDKIPVGPVTGATPVYLKNNDGGYTLTYKGEDFLDTTAGGAPATGKDIVWTMPAPKAH